MNQKPERLARVPRKAVVAAASLAALLLLLLYLQGTIGGGKVAPGEARPPGAAAEPAGRIVKVEKAEVEDLVDWPGTVTSRTVANIAPRVMARVVGVRVSVGSKAAEGEVVADLDDRDLRARVEQARAAVAAAEAQAVQAESDARRTRSLFQKQAATRQELEAVEARTKAARAQAAQARDGLAEANVMLGEATVRAPFAGVVAEKLVDPGDMAVPGKPIVVLYDPAHVRLEARLSERCAAMIAVGAQATARVDNVQGDIPVRIDEVAPMADPQSRTVLVKAALPARDEVLRPGTFGSLRTPCGRHTALLIPPAALIRTGQLETVQLIEEGQARPRHVRTGKTYGDRVEIISGLREGEAVAIGNPGL